MKNEAPGEGHDWNWSSCTAAAGLVGWSGCEALASVRSYLSKLSDVRQGFAKFSS